MDFQSLLTLMVVVWVAGKVFRAMNLPVIFGELLGGIIVGPLILNIVDVTSPTIEVLAELGIFFLMMHTGLDTDPKTLFRATKRSLLTSIVSLVLPFVSVFFITRYFGYDVEQALFFALALSITAVAIIARILKEYKIYHTKTGQTVMGAAIVNDILGLMLFSVILNFVETGSLSFQALTWMSFKLLCFFGLIIFGGMKLSSHIAPILKDRGFTFALIVALALGLIAEYIGLHMIIGAFLAGLLIREEIVDEKVFHKIEDRIYGLSYSFLGPIFFASLAFNLDFSVFFEKPIFIVICFFVAVLAKLAGSSIPVFFQIRKVSFVEAILIGLSMNSRGAVDLVIASIGFNMGILDGEIFAILVFLILVTTLFSIFAIRPLIRVAVS